MPGFPAMPPLGTTLRTILGAEARSSVSLDGETQSVPRPKGRPEPFNLGCPECGHRIPIEDASIGQQLIQGLRCCGLILEGDQAVRLLKAARLVEAERREREGEPKGALRRALDRYGR